MATLAPSVLIGSSSYLEVTRIAIAKAPAIRKMVIGGRKVAQISSIPSSRGTHWRLENQCLVNFKSCKSVEIMGCIHMAFYNAILENEGVHTILVISPLLLILHFAPGLILKLRHSTFIL